MNLAKLLLKNFFSNLSITAWLIIINVILFIIFSIVFALNPGFINYLAIKPVDVFAGKNLWTIFTNMFMHANLGHLFVNMFTLFFIGSFVERVIGRRRYLRFYIISGIIAGLLFSVLAFYFGDIYPRIFGTPDIIAVGASGAIFGLLGILAVLTPRARVCLIAGPLIAIILESILQIFIKNPSLISILDMLITFYFFLAIFSMFSFSSFRKIAIPIGLPFWLTPIVAIVPLIIIGLFVALPIGNTAHLGGLIVGLLYGWYLRRKYQKKVILLNKMVR